MLREIDLTCCQSEISSGANVRHVALTAPNFEERSTGAVRYLVEKFCSSADIRVYVATLQAAKPKEILDAVKDANLHFCLDLLRSKSIKFENKNILYPKIDYRAFFDGLMQYAVSDHEDVVLYLDLSSIPRLLIYKLLDYLLGDHFLARNEKAPGVVKKVRFFYSEPKAYPKTLNIEILGDVYCMYKDMPLHDEIQKYKVVDSIVFYNGNAHDVSQVLSISGLDVKHSDVKVHSFAYLNSEEFGFSYRKLWENIGSIGDIINSRGDIDILFDVEDICESLMEKIDYICERHQMVSAPTAIFFGCFGPKILGLCSYLARYRYDHKMKGFSGSRYSDLLTPKRSQYTSLYSHGLARTRLYELDVDALL